MPFDVQRLLSLGRVSSFAISPDGTWIAVAVSRVNEATGKFVSWLYRVKPGGSGEAQPLTRGESHDRAPAFRRDGALGFLSNRKRSATEADARDQVWLLPAGGGEPVPVTDEPLGVQSFKFARGADRLLVAAEVLPGVSHDNQRARAKELADKGPSSLRYTNALVRHWDHWYGAAATHIIAYDERGSSRRDLTPSADAEHRGDLEWDLSHDGTRAAVAERRLGVGRRPDTAIRLLDTASGESKLLGAASGVNLGAPVFSPTGASLACTHTAHSREAHGKSSLATLNVQTGELVLHAQQWDRWPTPMAFTGSSCVVVTAEEEGRCLIFSVDLLTDAVERLCGSAATQSFGAVEVHEGFIFSIAHDLSHPPEVFRSRCARDAEHTPITTLSGFSKEEIQVELRETTTRSTDGAMVHTFIVAPVGVTRPPVLLWIHGGPISAFGDLWHWRWNALVMAAAGYAVALPNPRGSTGYGQAFVEGIWCNQWGAQCFEDLMAVADALAADPRLDGTRMAAMGGSFGGYMTNWIGGHTARFKALVTHASIFHMEAFAGATDYPGWFQMEMSASPRGDGEALGRYSPHRFVSAWKSPTLILHGEKDYRVPIHESLMLFDALQELAIESELVVFPDENHWIAKPGNVAAWYGHVTRFLAAHLA
jgi:dienelactone hydrolase